MGCYAFGPQDNWLNGWQCMRCGHKRFEPRAAFGEQKVQPSMCSFTLMVVAFSALNSVALITAGL